MGFMYALSHINGNELKVGYHRSVDEFIITYEDPKHPISLTIDYDCMKILLKLIGQVSGVSASLENMLGQIAREWLEGIEGEALPERPHDGSPQL